MSLIRTYTPLLDAKKAAHLLRRATFGASPAQIKAFTGISAQTALQQLLTEIPSLPPPIDPATGQTFVDQPFDQASKGKWDNYLRGWWMAHILSGTSIHDKMTLFWQNHFVCSVTTVNDPRFMYRYLKLIRTQALGNFRTFVIEMTKDAAMLHYLNGHTNVVGNANENYARELQELFTIGRNNYTEEDVRTAARVLTGWRYAGFRSTQTGDITVSFKANLHDTGDKTFSSYYQNAVIKGRTGATAGDTELNELVDMILRQPETARFICRKLYRWFVNYEITPDIETNLIEPLAEIFRQNKYEIKPVLTALLGCEHFFDESVRGAIIKSPIELTLGMLNYFGVSVPDRSQQLANYYTYTTYINTRTREQQMDLLNQPTVFGYPPYYETDYYQVWINATTLALRGFFTDTITKGTYKISGKAVTFNSVDMVEKLSKPSDPVILMNDLTATLFAVDLTQKQKDFLIDEILIPGLPRYEWTAEWLVYKNDPTNTTKRMAVEMKLDNLFLFMLRMAEYQMV